jgi:Zn-dependent protease with chaperone function/type II secretory pathway pseudopilin PulG
MELKSLIYRREPALARLTLVLGLLGWLLLLLGTVGVVLLIVLLSALGYLFAQSAFISHIKGTAVRLSPTQFPDLYQRYQLCCARLEIRQEPAAYLLHGDGMFNAFATRFLGRNFVILLSDMVDAMEANPEGVNFYIGHELAHIRLGHLNGRFWRLPALWLPLLGAAYARAQESSCDLHGLACCNSPENAARAMAALAAGGRRWQTLNLDTYHAQVKSTRGFWMSYHELCSGYPWLTKRIARIQGHSVPGRHGLAWPLALFTPYAGGAGAALGPLILVAIIGILAAVAVPAYKDYTLRAKFAQDLQASAALKRQLGEYFEQQQRIPSLADLRAGDTLGNGAALSLDDKTMVLSVSRPQGGFLWVPSLGENGRISWTCKPAGETPARLLPGDCR